MRRRVGRVGADVYAVYRHVGRYVQITDQCHPAAEGDVLRVRVRTNDAAGDRDVGPVAAAAANAPERLHRRAQNAAQRVGPGAPQPQHVAHRQRRPAAAVDLLLVDLQNDVVGCRANRRLDPRRVLDLDRLPRLERHGDIRLHRVILAHLRLK